MSPMIYGLLTELVRISLAEDDIILGLTLFPFVKIEIAFYSRYENLVMSQKKSIKLFVAFLITFFVTGMGIGIYSIVYSVGNQLDTMVLPSQSKLILGIIALLVFDPMLFLICRYAKQERVRPIRIIASAVLSFISVCVLSEILPLL